jgi:Putative peptidoglycan binding domain
MPSPTSQCCIYEFSKKFDNIQQKNGIWVSGGFEIDKTKAFFRSNYGQGIINEIPFEIRKAVIDGLFEIPNAYPPNPLRNEEFYQKVANRQLDIAHPPIEDIALIARELNDYCVLAVATRQMDDKWRSKMVGYRYFWLKTSDLNTYFTQQVDGFITATQSWMKQCTTKLYNFVHNSEINLHEQEFLQRIDGIATLLLWWHKQGYPCFDMKQNSDENRTNKSQPCFSQQIIFQEEIISKYPKINKNSFPNLPVFFGPDEQLDYFNLHAQALHLCNTTMQKPAWAWNVRKLTKPETFTVVHCADRASYDQFFSPVLKPIEPSATTGSITVNSGSSNQSQQSDSSLNASLTTPSRSISSSSTPDTSDLEKSLKDVANNTESPSLRSLIEFYRKKPPKQHQELWRNCFNQEVLKNPEKIQYQVEVNHLILVGVFIWDVQSQGESGQQSTYNFSEKHKNWAIEYLNNLSASISKYENTDKQSVSQLKRNIADLRKSLSGEDPSQGNDNLLESALKLLKNIGGNNYSRLTMGLFIILVFFSFLPLEINPLKPMINKIFSVAPSPQEPGASKDANQKYTVQLQAARKFIKEKSVTTECKDGGSFATPSECQIYKKTKSTLPDWPELPEPPQGAPIKAGESSAPKMLARNRDKKNPDEMVIFLQQSLKISGAKKVGDLGVFDETLEKAVKEFQKNKCKQPDDGQVGSETWKCLSNYVQKQQVIAVLDYQIESLKPGETDLKIEEHIQKCKNSDPKNLQKLILPEDFIKCLKPVK